MVLGITKARPHQAAVSGTTIRIISPVRKWTWKSSGRRIVIVCMVMSFHFLIFPKNLVRSLDNFLYTPRLEALASKHTH